MVKENYSNRLSEPSFRQRSYITFRIERRRVLSIYTHANSTDLKFHFRSEEIKNHEAEEIKEKINAKKAEKKKQRYFKIKIPKEYDIPEDDFKEALEWSIDSISKIYEKD